MPTEKPNNNSNDELARWFEGLKSPTESELQQLRDFLEHKTDTFVLFNSDPTRLARLREARKQYASESLQSRINARLSKRERSVREQLNRQ